MNEAMQVMKEYEALGARAHRGRQKIVDSAATMEALVEQVKEDAALKAEVQTLAAAAGTSLTAVQADQRALQKEADALVAAHPELAPPESTTPE